MEPEENAAAGEDQEQEQAGVPSDRIATKVLVLPSKRCPFEDWYKSIKDATTRMRIEARLSRLRAGNLGDFKPVGGEVFEIRLDFGPGYRLYFARVGNTIVILLTGGDKSTQQKDIDRARDLWKEYKDNAERYKRDFSG